MSAEKRARRRIRLAPEIYADVGRIVSITIAVKDRRPVFAAPEVAEAAVVVLRRLATADERVEHVVEYVLNNPVRAGLVERQLDYRFSGSTVFASIHGGGGQAPALQRSGGCGEIRSRSMRKESDR
jgi:hypothetical protein